MKRVVKNLLRSAGYKLVPVPKGFDETTRQEKSPVLPDMEPEFGPIYDAVYPYTMTTVENVYATYDTTRYVVANEVPGDFVECGVWRGGNAMAALLTLLKMNQSGRSIYLYDTFAGMTEPTEKDVSVAEGQAVKDIWQDKQTDEGVNEWCYAGIDSVRKNLLSTGYPEDRMHFVKGKVEDTLPAVAPPSIAWLRLDTDWYDSTMHELVHLYPLLSVGGVLIIDDYGVWKGQRDAVDEYFQTQKLKPYLARINSGTRVMIKTG